MYFFVKHSFYEEIGQKNNVAEYKYTKFYDLRKMNLNQASYCKTLT